MEDKNTQFRLHLGVSWLNGNIPVRFAGRHPGGIYLWDGTLGEHTAGTAIPGGLTGGAHRWYGILARHTGGSAPWRGHTGGIHRWYDILGGTYRRDRALAAHTGGAFSRASMKKYHELVVAGI